MSPKMAMLKSRAKLYTLGPATIEKTESATKCSVSTGEPMSANTRMDGTTRVCVLHIHEVTSRSCRAMRHTVHAMVSETEAIKPTVKDNRV